MITSTNLPFLSHLNPEQRQAVSITRQHLRVLAGAGSGKTQVLVSRIATLLHQESLLPSQFLAVTFTNKAAREMQDRLQSYLRELYLPHSHHDLWVGTFHHIAHRLLRRHAEAANLTKDFQILDAADQQRRIRRIIRTMNLDESRFSPKSVQWFINQQKDMISNTESSYPSNPHQKILTNIYETYEQSCRQDQVLDFSDLLLRSRDLLIQNPYVLKNYHQRFRYILVDEFQDTSRIQYEWIKLLTGEGTYLTIVGDDDQSIYGWRGAKIENMYHFERDFPNNQTIRLEQNYRSTRTILSAANALISNNQQRLGKNLWTEQPSGEPIQVYEALNDLDEAHFIVERIKKQSEAGIPYQDIALLYRSNAQSRVLEEALMQANIPYRVYGGLRFFERAEIKDTLAYLRLIHKPTDNSAFDRVINTPPRGIGEKTLQLIRNTAQRENLSYYETSQHLLTVKAFPTRSENALQSFFDMLASLTEGIKPYAINIQIEKVLEASGLKAYYQKESAEKGQSRLDNLNELIYAARQFVDKADEENSLVSFLNTITLDNTEYEHASNESVQLMTLHAAKGLEFPVVFLTGLEEGLFPNHLALSKPSDLEEERRLCYVGITRAMRQLYLTYAKIRSYHGTATYRLLSRFIEEIPTDFLFFIKQSSTTWDTPLQDNQIHSKNIDKKIGDTEFRLHQSVRHKSFGVGRIINYEGEGPYTRVQVKFDTKEVKWLILYFAKLEPII